MYFGASRTLMLPIHLHPQPPPECALAAAGTETDALARRQLKQTPRLESSLFQCLIFPVA